MEPWMWGVVAGVPVVALGAAYASGAFSTKTSSLDQSLKNYNITPSIAKDPSAMEAAVQQEKTAFTGDTEGGKRKKKIKTKKSKSSHKKTKRRR